MSSILPINVKDLLQARGVESPRIEFKASWEEKTVGLQVLHTISAFANDLQNLNGGYIIIGVAEENGVAKLPPRGVELQQIDSIQRWIRGKCNTLDPIYQPVISPEEIDGRHILLVWAPAGDTRPYQSPETLDKGAKRSHYVRIGSDTVIARGEIHTQLIQLTAKVPFDDRRALNVPVEKIRDVRVREFLTDIGSDLAQERNPIEVYRNMRISVRVNDHDAPKNVGLLFFSDDPQEWFPGTRIDVVQFAADSSGNVIEERTFRGPLHHHLRECLAYLENFTTQHLEKLADRPEVKGWVSYPAPALREALVNAVYHRSYEGQSEPIKVYLYTDRIEIISYPGPVPGIEPKHLQQDARIPPVPARNRRIGELLKELKLAEGRGTGIPKVYRSMSDNSSPMPTFDFDEQRTFFRVILPAHPEYVAITALRDAAHLGVVGDAKGATSRLRLALAQNPTSETIASALITDLAKQGAIDEARAVFGQFSAKSGIRGVRVIMAMSGALLDAQRLTEAAQVLDTLPKALSSQEAIQAAISERRAKREQRAHTLFLEAGDAVSGDPRALLEFAQTKIRLAIHLPERMRRDPYQRDATQRLLREAKDMLQRVIQMDTVPLRRAWAWYELGRVLRRLKAPKADVRHAFEQAVHFAPEEPRFLEALQQLDSGDPP